ncbi:uncharacterized protein EI90DRAFT_2482980 [Cantharellus anzutake]|uniref:uncharacterized protein n=1 Tax=Cantharellus anzutake TaxID=1750568 RepID=UPI0019067D12|nr:uncharacterized protein EI90DRAFT_2482980 [Cantharellus anzutake]KAF8322359.1 hypothetical protein EI90DRAFT_2482980 [Cantharellus anzutake]
MLESDNGGALPAEYIVFEIGTRDCLSAGRAEYSKPLSRVVRLATTCYPITTFSAAADMTSAVEYLVNSDASINDKLAALRLDEIVTMNIIGTTTYARTRGNNWFRLLFFNIGVYTWYLRVTWGYVFCSWIIGELPICDWALTVVISLLTSIVLLVALIFCQLVNIPPVRGIYSWISNRCFNGLGLINACRFAL